MLTFIEETSEYQIHEFTFVTETEENGGNVNDTLAGQTCRMIDLTTSFTRLQFYYI